MRLSRLPSILLLAAACQAAPPAQGTAETAPGRPAIASAGDILALVAASHADAPSTAAFTQVNVITLPSGNITQRQRVLVDAPDRMRVDNLPVSGRTGAIYTGSRAISFSAGRRVAGTDDRNALLLLGFGVFRQPAAASLSALAALGVRTSVIRQATFQGSPVWVVGAAPGDTTANQVWFDSERWLPVRFIQSQRVGTRTLLSDTRYSGHAAPAPTVPRTIEVYRDGRRVLSGSVDGLRVGLALTAATFDTTALRTVTY